MADSEFPHSSYSVTATIETPDTLFHKRRRCFCFPSTNQLTRTIKFDYWWHRLRSTAVNEGSVWSKGINALKKLREWSEIVAGPRWKTFIRRFNRNKSGSSRSAKFQYDPLSYSLNFDEGRGNNGEEEEELVLRNFSTRYASIPASGKVNMDEGPGFV
ncbi:putative RNA-dependent RNA polymerase 2-like [Capsicum annuum]|uniref:Uncharacterized protein n=1 Tax=Capsicum annuum TaxID=4072 RepID=A0A1U8H4L8_CAPAN|nr:uncharacterized protein LOC107875918 [Capsicum annuum]KAF3652713.1 putative RNA-dependent RNA polymerase 2-like [Capsicum annuum]KAF3659168.1 putative RNA-dependent RNA polymerase 2-like [Capsicum annuum]PHT79709.1 hypothetical protein T459_17761 [Capsicum annuum]